MALTIIHTADLHGRLDRRGAEALRFLAEQTGALLLDSGDAISAGNVYVRAREPVLEVMNAAGYDAMAMGNREFFFRKSGLLRKTAQARFPVLATNVLPLRDDLGHVLRWTVLDTGGRRVGVLGLTPTMIAPASFAERLPSGWWRSAIAAWRTTARWPSFARSSMRSWAGTVTMHAPRWSARVRRSSRTRATTRARLRSSGLTAARTGATMLTRGSWT